MRLVVLAFSFQAYLLPKLRHVVLQGLFIQPETIDLYCPCIHYGLASRAQSIDPSQQLGVE
jgi:hypothetical protein